jgi:hypothetical protein
MESNNQPVITQEPVVAKESDTKTVVGLDGLTLPTPDKIKAIFKMVTFFVVVIGLVLNGIKEIPADTKELGLEIMGVLVIVLQKAEDFFGIKIQ